MNFLEGLTSFIGLGTQAATAGVQLRGAVQAQNVVNTPDYLLAVRDEQLRAAQTERYVKLAILGVIGFIVLFVIYSTISKRK